MTQFAVTCSIFPLKQIPIKLQSQLLVTCNIFPLKQIPPYCSPPFSVSSNIFLSQFFRGSKPDLLPAFRTNPSVKYDNPDPAYRDEGRSRTTVRSCSYMSAFAGPCTISECQSFLCSSIF